MLPLSPTTQVFLACGPTDMRKAFDGLAGIVEEKLEKDPTSGQLFVFCNRRKDRLKVLWWDGSGLCLFAKRLEKGTFEWPASDEKCLRYRVDELQLLLAGINVARVQRRRWYHKPHPEDDLRRKGSDSLKEGAIRVRSRA